ncbi:uncharacterized protein MYCGRDRAFT_14753, partial [Zymoseptoria tritici IPO323]
LLDSSYGNPCSSSLFSTLPADQMGCIRLRILGLFNADPQVYDVVFVQNIQAAVEIIGHSLQEMTGKQKGPQWLGYYAGMYSNIACLTESRPRTKCFGDEHEVQTWIRKGKFRQRRGLFAYPGQTTPGARVLPLEWYVGAITIQFSQGSVYVMVDASALCCTGGLDFSYHYALPDFVTVTLDRIFGYPDLSALLIRRAAIRQIWGHGVAAGPIHKALEGASLPTHKLLALDCAITVLYRLYGTEPMSTISQHTTSLIKTLYSRMSSARHRNGQLVCEFYDNHMGTVGDASTHGATIVFNILAIDGTMVDPDSVLAFARQRHIYLGSADV